MPKTGLKPALTVLPVLLFLLLSGCTGSPGQKVGFSLTYLILGEDNITSQGTVSDSISFPRGSVYFQIRANITNKDNVTHHLEVLDQQSGTFKTTLPLYSEETLNGIKRGWGSLGWAETMSLPPATDGDAYMVPFAPGEEKALEAPVFFFNQVAGPRLSPENELVIRIVDSDGMVLGEKTITIRVTG